tara:strand:+ start:20877 stop:22184 length:1308 start_codon:yes stop_codon:yes gene_type:complete
MNTANTEVDQEIVSDQEKTAAASHDTNNDAGYTPQVSEQQAPVEQEPEQAPKPLDARQEILDKIQDRVEQNRQSEKEAIDASFEKPAPTAPEPVANDSDYVDLKVRKQTHRMTVKDRNELLIEEHGAEEVADMTEREKNRFAQFAVAQKQYSDELNKVKGQVNEASKAQPQQQQIVQPVTPAAPVEPEKTPIEAAKEALTYALDEQQFGVEGANERVSQAYVELSRVTSGEEANQREIEQKKQWREQRFEDDNQSGIDEGYAVLSKQAPDFAHNPVNRDVLYANYDTAKRSLIAAVIDKETPQQRQAFIDVGITPDSLGNARGDKLQELYKSMALQGYALPRLSHVFPTVAQNFITRAQGNTQPAPTGQQQGQDEGQQPLKVDRQERKSAIQNQPGRVAIPSNSNPPQKTVQTPAERHKAAAAEERAARGKRKIR